MKQLPKLEDVMKNKKKFLDYFKQTEQVYNAILENQEMYVKEHNEHDDRIARLEEEIERLKKSIPQETGEQSETWRDRTT